MKGTHHGALLENRLGLTGITKAQTVDKIIHTGFTLMLECAMLTNMTEEFGLHRLLRRKRKHRSRIVLTVADIIPLVIPKLNRIFTPDQLIDAIEATYPGLPYDDRSVYAILAHNYHRVSKRTRHKLSYWTVRDPLIHSTNGDGKMDYSNQVDVDHKGRPILSARRRQLKADAIALKAKVKSLLEHAHTLDLLLEKSNGQGVKGQPSQSKIAEAIGGVTNVRVSQLTRELRKEYPHIDKLFTRHMHNRRSNDKVMTERAIGEWLMDQVAEYEHVHGEYSAEWVQELATTIRDGKWGG